MSANDTLVPRLDTPDTWTVIRNGLAVGTVTRYHVVGHGRSQFEWGTGEPGLQNPTFLSREEAISALSSEQLSQVLI